MRDRAIDILNSHNIRPSEQRIAVLKYLLSNRIHPTVDDIYVALTQSMPTLSKTTVYNVLKNLVENGAVLALTIDDKNVRYDAIVEPHSHFRCRCCGRIIDCPAPEFKSDAIDGCIVEETHVYYRGLCAGCVEITERETGGNC